MILNYLQSKVHEKEIQDANFSSGSMQTGQVQDHLLGFHIPNTFNGEYQTNYNRFDGSIRLKLINLTVLFHQ